MSTEQEIEAIFSLLKEHLKTKKISYNDLAEKLEMSESNVKRIFSARSCSLQQIAEICNAAETSFIDLISIVQKKMSPEFILPATAEEFFLKNFEAFILYRHIFGAQTPEDVVEKSKIPADRLNFYIKNYVEMGLIKKKRGNLEVIGKGYFNLSQCPALAHRLIEKWVPWFMDRAVAYKGKPDYDLKAMSTGLSKIHKAQLLEDLERLFQRYKDIGFQDQKVGTEEFESVGVCIGIGPHRIGFFEEKNSTTAARRY